MTAVEDEGTPESVHHAIACIQKLRLHAQLEWAERHAVNQRVVGSTLARLAAVGASVEGRAALRAEHGPDVVPPGHVVIDAPLLAERQRPVVAKGHAEVADASADGVAARWVERRQTGVRVVRDGVAGVPLPEVHLPLPVTDDTETVGQLLIHLEAEATAIVRNVDTVAREGEVTLESTVDVDALGDLIEPGGRRGR